MRDMCDIYDNEKIFKKESSQLQIQMNLLSSSEIKHDLDYKTSWRFKQEKIISNFEQVELQIKYIIVNSLTWDPCNTTN